MAIQSAQPEHGAATQRCAACGGPLIGGYYTLFDRTERYCQNCVAAGQFCASCGLPLGPNYWQLHDGRRQCARCHSTAIYDPAVARTIFDETVAALIAQFDLRLNVGVEFRLVDAPTLNALRSPEGAADGATAETPDTARSLLGVYQRYGWLRIIYMLYGLPRLIFRITVAHEYAHAWQGENCPLLRDETLREGFAEWIAYHHLNWIGSTRAAQRMLTEPHLYRPLLDHLLGLERQLGIAGVIEYIKRAE
jgi:hypothetical protein